MVMEFSIVDWIDIVDAGECFDSSSLVSAAFLKHSKSFQEAGILTARMHVAAEHCPLRRRVIDCPVCFGQKLINRYVTDILWIESDYGRSLRNHEVPLF